VKVIVIYFYLFRDKR